MTQQEFLNTMLQLASQATKDLESGKSESDVKAQMQKVAEETGALYYRPENSSGLPFEMAHMHQDLDQGSWGKSDNDIINRLLYEYTNASDEDVKRAYQQDLMNYFMAINERDYNKGLTADERAYNLAMLQEQRQYDLPQQQLQRLMATGLSRQAALSMLNGGSGGSGSGSLVGSSQSIPSPDLGVHEYNHPAGTSLRNKTGAFVDITTGLANLASTALTGVNVGNALKTGALLDNQIWSGKMQNDAVDSVGQFMGALYSNKPDGTPNFRPQPGLVRNAESLLSWAQSVSREDNEPLYNFVHSSEFDKFANNPFAWNLYDSTYATHSNAAQEKTEQDYITQSELLQLQKKLSSVNLEGGEMNLEKLCLEMDELRDLAPYLKSYHKMQVQDDIAMLAAAQTPEQLKYRMSYIQNHNETMAYIAMIDRLNSFNLWDRVSNSNMLQNLLVSGSICDRLGFNGIVGDVVRLGVFGSDALSNINSEISSETSDQTEQSIATDLFKGHETEPKGGLHLYKAVKDQSDAIRVQIRQMFYEKNRQAWIDFWQSGQNVSVPEMLIPSN